VQITTITEVQKVKHGKQSNSLTNLKGSIPSKVFALLDNDHSLSSSIAMNSDIIIVYISLSNK